MAGTLYKETSTFNELHDRFRFETYAKLKGITDIARAKKEFLALYEKHGSNSAVFRALGQPSSYWMQQLDDLDFNSVLKPDPEISRTIEELHRLVPVSLFTNFVRYRIDGLLEHLQISPSFFTHIIAGEDVKERKPALDGFKLMIQKSELPPEQILYVGDREAVDILPAKELGMQAALLYGESERADYNFKDFKDVLSLITTER